MATFLFDKIIFGPVKSRRLGNSLGINLLPINFKICNFNCIYCECGWTFSNKEKFRFISPEEYKLLIENEFKKIILDKIIVDTITFAGNGEPTMHPQFDKIIDITTEARDAFIPEAKIAVLSNSTLIGNRRIFNSLQKIDQNILKLDSGIVETIKLLNSPPKNFTINKLVKGLQKFKGNFIMQTMFVKGEFHSKKIDNSSDPEVNEWLKLVKKTRPKLIMIYTIKRDTPVHSLQPISLTKLKEISALLRSNNFDSTISE